MNGMIYQANELIEKIKSAREFDGIHSSSIYYLVIEKLNPKLQGSKTYDTEFGRNHGKTRNITGTYLAMDG